jgi:hypothetical protein
LSMMPLLNAMAVGPKALGTGPAIAGKIYGATDSD